MTGALFMVANNLFHSVNLVINNIMTLSICFKFSNLTTGPVVKAPDTKPTIELTGHCTHTSIHTYTHSIWAHMLLHTHMHTLTPHLSSHTIIHTQAYRYTHTI